LTTVFVQRRRLYRNTKSDLSVSVLVACDSAKRSKPLVVKAALRRQTEDNMIQQTSAKTTRQ